MENINKFCEKFGFRFNEGEIGFGRPCVGIINPTTECYVSYQTYTEDYECDKIHDVAYNTQPDRAYHKGPYLAVLHDGDEESKKDAIEALEKWIKNILTAGVTVDFYTEKNSFASFMSGGSVTQKCITGGMTYTQFKMRPNN